MARRNTLGLQDMPAPWLKMLVQDHLDEPARLCLFQACKATAQLVVYHAATAQFTVKQHARQCQQICLDLLSYTPGTLHIHLHRGVALFLQLPKDRMVQLTLHLTCFKELLLRLQLHTHQRLHTLVFTQHCAHNIDPAEARALANSLSEWLPPSLTRLVFEEHCSPACIRRMSEVLGTQITHLTVHDASNEYLQQHLHAAFPCLTHILTRWDMSNAIVARLLSHPTRTHLTVAQLSVRKDYSRLTSRSHGSSDSNTGQGTGSSSRSGRKQGHGMCSGSSWQVLHVTQASRTEHLTCLPLHLLQQLKLQVGLVVSDDTKPHELQALLQCPSVVCVPCMVRVAQGHRYKVITISGAYTADVIAKCSQHLSGGLRLLPSTSIFNEATLSAVAALAATIDLLWIGQSSAADYMSRKQAGKYWGPFAASLPSHINHVVLQNLDMWHAGALAAALATCRHVAKVTIMRRWYDQAGAELLALVAEGRVHLHTI